MGADFPVPRSLLPRVHVTPCERQARKAQMEQMLGNALDDYDRFRHVDHSRVDASRWKHVETKGTLKLYREREVGLSGLKLLSSSLSAVPSFLASDGTNSSTSSLCNASFDDASYEAASAATLIDERHRTKSLLVVGTMGGRVDTVVDALLATTNNEHALVQSFLHDGGVADGAVLNTIEAPTRDDPLRFLGYKWVVKKAPGGSARLMKHRDVVYVESCGVTKTVTGETIGYVLVESVDLPSFPALTDRNCIRAVQSISILVRQKSDARLDVFVTGWIVPSGKVVHPLASRMAAQAVLTIAKAMALAECKALTKLAVDQQHGREIVLESNNYHMPTACTLCQQTRKFYNGVSLTDCSLCGAITCTRCQTQRRIYFAGRILGHFHRVACCTACVQLTADPLHSAATRRALSVSVSSRQTSQRECDRATSFGSLRERPHAISEASLCDSNEAGERRVPSLPSPLDDDEISMLTKPDRSRKHAGVTLLAASSAIPKNSGRYKAAMVSSPPDEGCAPCQRDHSGSAPGRYQLQAEPLRVGRKAHSMSTGGRAAASDSVASQEEFFPRILELRRLAESSYRTSQQHAPHYN